MIRKLLERWQERRILRYATAHEVYALAQRVDELERSWVEQTEKVQHYFRKQAARERKRLERAIEQVSQPQVEQPESEPVAADPKAHLRARFSQRRAMGGLSGAQREGLEGEIPG